MSLQLGALLICVVVFAIGLYRGVNVGILMLVAASGVGVGLADMAMKEVLDGYPVDLLILLAGVTLFFGVAQVNGTVERLIDAALRKVGDRTAVLPLAFFGMTAAVASMGNPGAALVVMPIGMNVAHKQNIQPILMAISMGTGMSVGGFSPTSTYGIVIGGIAQESRIELSSMLLFAVALAVNLVLLAAAYLLFGRDLRRASTRAATRAYAIERNMVSIGDTRTSSRGSGVEGDIDDEPVAANSRGALTPIQKLTVGCLVALIGIVLVANLLDVNPDIGVLTFALSAILILVDPATGKSGASKIDWNTILLVGGIITYVSVLQKVGTVDMLGDFAASMSVPLLAVLVICVIAGLVSAFASTIGMLAVLVPLAVPLVISGGVPGWAMICAIGICASIVDVSPFSSNGATMIATSPDPADHPRLTKLLMRWGLSLVIVGPVAMIGALILPSMLL